VLTLLQPGKADQVPTAESETARCMRCYAKGFSAGDKHGSRMHFAWGWASGACCVVLLQLAGWLAWQAVRPFFF
jgi:hypothetical protein